MTIIEDKAIENLDAWRDCVATSKWHVRDEMFCARMTALEAAMDRDRHLRVVVSGVALGLAAAVVLLSWPTTPGYLVLAVVDFFVARSIGRLILGRRAQRIIAQIDVDYPKPLPLRQTHS